MCPCLSHYFRNSWKCVVPHPHPSCHMFTAARSVEQRSFAFTARQWQEALWTLYSWVYRRSNSFAAPNRLLCWFAVAGSFPRDRNPPLCGSHISGCYTQSLVSTEPWGRGGFHSRPMCRCSGAELTWRLAAWVWEERKRSPVSNTNTGGGQAGKVGPGGQGHSWKVKAEQTTPVVKRLQDQEPSHPGTWRSWPEALNSV